MREQQRRYGGGEQERWPEDANHSDYYDHGKAERQAKAQAEGQAQAEAQAEAAEFIIVRRIVGRPDIVAAEQFFLVVFFLWIERIIRFQR